MILAGRHHMVPPGVVKTLATSAAWLLRGLGVSRGEKGGGSAIAKREDVFIF
eukprot:SAG22_NODE_12707_length_432_cov_0.882883_1_plen_52_part_00